MSPSIVRSITLICASIIASTASACLCGEDEWYLTLEDTAQTEELVAVVEVVSLGEKQSWDLSAHENMVVEIVEVWKGDTEHQRIWILGGRRGMCSARIFGDTYPIGSQFLVAMSPKDGKLENGIMQICGEHHALVRDGTIERFRTLGKKTIRATKLEDFRKELLEVIREED